MSLGTDIAAALPELRAAAVSRMTETVRVGLLVEGTDENFDVIHTLEVAYDGVGRLKFNQLASSDVDAGGQPVVKEGSVLSLPSGTEGITPDMRVVVDESTADGSLVGRVFRVKGFAAAGQTTANRWTVEETGERIL